MSLQDRETRLVAPFYLQLMGYNATWTGHEVWDDAIATGRSASAEDVAWLLERREWRPNVMGAWFSLARPPTEVADKVVDTLSASAGSLTAPPLAVAAVLLAGRSAEPVLRGGGARSDEVARAAFDAALVWLELDPEDAVAGSDVEKFRELAHFGLRLRAAVTER